MNENTAPAVYDFPANTPSPDWSPRLTFYHPNAKGTGSALQLELTAASSTEEGSLFCTLAAQKGVPSGNDGSGERRFATFDWSNKIAVKCGFTEVADLLLVLSGASPAAGPNGKGFFHTTSRATTIVSCRRSNENGRDDVLLGVTRTPKDRPDARQYVGIALRPAECLGLRIALEHALGAMAFGTPRPRKATAPKTVEG